MTAVYITIDTEYSSSLARSGMGWRENHARSIACETPAGAVGIRYQMDMFDRHGLRAVFFVDPMPALFYGPEAVAAMVKPIVARGHDVQLHLHTEWLALAGEANPLGAATGRNMKDFSQEQQARLLAWGCDAIEAAGAPRPIAFRAGNYGANDDTLRALAKAGLRYDSSHTPGIANGECAISLGPETRQPVRHAGAIEVPVGLTRSLGGRERHAQLTALSTSEIMLAIRHARRSGAASFTLVSHSFELLSRDRMGINRIVRRRFERLCRRIERAHGVHSATYATDPPVPATRSSAPLPPVSELRSAWRLGEQALGNALYGRD